MEKTKATRKNITLLNQMFQYIPRGMVEKLSGGEKIKARTLTYSGQIYALLYGHFSGAYSLNEICDTLKIHESQVERIRGMSAPYRNTFSNANRTRNPQVAENLFWGIFEHMQALCPAFGKAKNTGNLFRFHRNIYALDATTLQLSLKSMDWAKHRSKKAAARIHMRSDVAAFLPRFVVVDKAKPHESNFATKLCEGVNEGDIIIADRGYNDFRFLYALTKRGVNFVLRDKINMLFEFVGENSPAHANILSDSIIRLTGVDTQKDYPQPMRRVVATVEVDDNIRQMSFITNNMTWAASSIASLYKARWSIELLFKELKQTLQLKDFFGENENAVYWQIWTALIVHLLIRFTAFLSKWKLSFSRLVAILRSALLMRIDLYDLLKFYFSYGTAPSPKERPPPEYTPFLPNFLRSFQKAMGQHST